MIRAVGGTAEVEGGRLFVTGPPEAKQIAKDRKAELVAELERIELFGLDPRGEYQGSPEEAVTERLWEICHALESHDVQPAEARELRRLCSQVDDAGLQSWALYDQARRDLAPEAKRLAAILAAAVDQRAGLTGHALWLTARRVLVDEQRADALSEVFG
jgi:hypothetical protein